MAALLASFQTPYPCSCECKGANATRIWHYFPNVPEPDQAISVFVWNGAPHRSAAHLFQGCEFLARKWGEPAFGSGGESGSYSCHDVCQK